MQVYPNPVASQLHVQFALEKNAQYAQVFVTDLSGRRVKMQNMSAPGNIDVSHLPPGVYLVTVNGATKKFIKQ